MNSNHSRQAVARQTAAMLASPGPFRLLARQKLVVIRDAAAGEAAVDDLASERFEVRLDVLAELLVEERFE